MKRPFLSSLTIVLSFVLVQCTKSGPAGAAGQTGPTGAKGDPGTANVIYSPWMVVDSSAWWYNPAVDSSGFNYPNNADTAIFMHATLSTPAVTQGVLDSGLVFYYFKEGVGPRKGQVTYWDPWDNNNAMEVGVTNRPVNWNGYQRNNTIGMSSYYVIPEQYDSLSVSSISFRTSWEDWTGRWSYNSQYNVFTYRDLKPKTKFYIRYVVIPGGIKNGRQATIDYKDYEAVKNHYHLTD